MRFGEKWDLDRQSQPMASGYGESLGKVSRLVIGGCNVVPTAQAQRVRICISENMKPKRDREMMC